MSWDFILPAGLKGEEAEDPNRDPPEPKKGENVLRHTNHDDTVSDDNDKDDNLDKDSNDEPAAAAPNIPAAGLA